MRQNKTISSIFSNLLILRHQFIKFVFKISVIIILILYFLVKEASKTRKLWRTLISPSSPVVTWVFDSEISSKDVHPNLRIKRMIWSPSCYKSFWTYSWMVTKKWKWSISVETHFFFKKNYLDFKLRFIMM